MSTALMRPLPHPVCRANRYLAVAVASPSNHTEGPGTNTVRAIALPGLWGDFSLSGNRGEGQAAEMEEDVRL